MKGGHPSAFERQPTKDTHPHNKDQQCVLNTMLYAGIEEGLVSCRYMVVTKLYVMLHMEICFVVRWEYNLISLTLRMYIRLYMCCKFEEDSLKAKILWLEIRIMIFTERVGTGWVGVLVWKLVLSCKILEIHVQIYFETTTNKFMIRQHRYTCEICQNYVFRIESWIGRLIFQNTTFDDAFLFFVAFQKI